MEPRLTPADALIVVDVQIDFCPGGRLPVPDGHAVVPVVNRWIGLAQVGGALVAASRDWHPADHSSFAENGGPWPAHCIQGTEGAGFHPDLVLPADAWIISKGDRRELDQYSAFEATTLAADLRRKGVKRVFVAGLAQDVCVLATVLDATRLGFASLVLAGGTRALSRASGAAALADMRRAGATILEEA